MKKNIPIEQLVDAAMNSLDGLQPAEANPFLYTRIEQRLKNQQQVETYGKSMFRLALVLIAFIILNVFTYDKLSSNNNMSQSKTGAEAFASDYGLQQNMDNY
jgi:hypothetical protein